MVKINKNTRFRWQEAVKKTYQSKVAEIIKGNCILHTIDGVVEGKAGDFIVIDIKENPFIITKSNIKYNYSDFQPTNSFVDIESLFINKSDDFKLNYFTATRVSTKIKYVCIYDNFHLETSNGNMFGKAFDYIIKTPNTGYLYRIDADIFAKTYDVIDNDYKIYPQTWDIDYFINIRLEGIKNMPEIEIGSPSRFLRKLIELYHDTICKLDYQFYEDWSHHEQEFWAVYDHIDNLREIIVAYRNEFF